MHIKTANEAYLDLLNKVYQKGEEVTCRGHKTIEIRNNTTVIDMRYPLVTFKERKVGYRFAAAEASWILNGDNKVVTIQDYSRAIANFSDDGVFFFGAYGPKIVDQLEYIGRCFKSDIFTRQAIINIWREKPPVSKDIPCTLNMQFMIRFDDLGRYILHTTVNMRSSDCWLGIPYDWFSFSMISIYVALYLKEILKCSDIIPGNLTLNAGSQHIYYNSFGYDIRNVEAVLFSNEVDFDYEPYYVDSYTNAEEFKSELQSIKLFKQVNGTFLKEIEGFYNEKNR